MNDRDWCYWFSGLCDGEASFTYDCANPKRGASPRFKLTMQGEAALIREIAERFVFRSPTLDIQPRTKRDNGKSYALRDEWDVKALRHCEALVAFFRSYPLRSRKLRAFEIWSELVAEYALRPRRPLRRTLIALGLSTEMERQKGKSDEAQSKIRAWLAQHHPTIRS